MIYIIWFFVIFFYANITNSIIGFQVKKYGFQVKKYGFQVKKYGFQVEKTVQSPEKSSDRTIKIWPCIFGLAKEPLVGSDWQNQVKSSALSRAILS